MIDLVPLGDRAWLARFPDEADARRWADGVRAKGLAGVVDVVLAYRSASVHVDPDKVEPGSIETTLRAIEPAGQAEAGRRVWLPVLYDGEDLPSVADRLGLTADEVVALHAGTTYDVFAIGFQPGFPYAGYLPAPLSELPRRSEPRLRVPAGSVAIAAGQTGVYPSELPGGWHLLGRTPLRIVDLPLGHFPIRAGDRLRFVPIVADEFDRLRGVILP